MNSSEQYRETLYTNYFNDRYDSDTIRQKLSNDLIHFEKEILPLLNKPETATVLDLGCGHGNMMLVLQQKGFTNVFGIDISEDQIRMANELGLKNAIQGDFMNYLSSRTETFDVILGIDILEHLKKGELTSLLQQVHRALKPGGVAVFRTPNADGIGNSVFSAGDFTHENILNGFSAEQVCLAAGFKDITVLQSYIRTPNPLKEILRKLVWTYVSLHKRLELFGAGLSTQKVILTPNLIIRVIKK